MPSEPLPVVARFRLVSCLLASTTLSIVASGSSAQDNPTRDDGAPPPVTTTLLKELEAFRTSLDRAARISTTKGSLGVSVHVYPDAREYEVVDRLIAELAKEKPLPLVVEAVREKQKELARLEGKAGVRLEFTHPRHDPKRAPGKPEDVHFIAAKLDKSAPLTVGKKQQRWTAWREPTELERVRVRIARHYKFVKRREVPIVSALKPKTERFVFRGERAALWGLVPRKAIEDSRRRVALRLVAYDEYRGPYDRRHIVDLNAESHSWQRELSLEVEGSFPKVWPQATPRIREIIDRVLAAR